MYRAHIQLGETERAASHLQKAAQYSEAWSDIRSLSESLYSDAMQSLEQTENKKPLDLLEKAVWALEIGIGITARNRIQAELKAHSHADHDANYNPWLQSMIALCTAEPKAAFETDISWIRNLIEHAEYETATNRIHDAMALLAHFSLTEVDAIQIQYHLEVLLAQSEYAQHQSRRAIRKLQTAIKQADGVLPLDEVLFGQSLLLRWLREAGDLEAGREVMKEVMQRLQSEDRMSASTYME